MLLAVFMFYGEMYKESANQFESTISHREKLFVS